MEWLVAGIFALIGGGLGLADSLISDTNAENFINEQYKLKKKEAELGYEQAKDEAKRNADKADLQADMTDKAQDIQEKGLSADFNAAIDNLYLNQANDTWSWNNASMQMASQQGAGLANIAASGIRSGSSLNDALLMESATNEAQLQFSQDAKRRSDNNNLASVLNGIAGQNYGIYQNRVAADQTRSDALWLRKSYDPEGYNYNLYQNQLKQMQTKKDYEIDQHTGWNKALNAASAFFGLGAKGWQVGTDAYNTYQQGKDYIKTLGGQK